MTVEGNCCWKMLENEGSNATEVQFFPGKTVRKPSINKITSITSYKCNASEDKVAQNSFTYGGINYHNNFTGNVHTLFWLSLLHIRTYITHKEEQIGGTVDWHSKIVTSLYSIFQYDNHKMLYPNLIELQNTPLTYSLAIKGI